MRTRQIALTTVAEMIADANVGRVFFEVKNTDASISVYIGRSGDLTTGNGHLLKAGEAFGAEGWFGPVWAVAASGTPTVTMIEW